MAKTEGTATQAAIAGCNGIRVSHLWERVTDELRVADQLRRATVAAYWRAGDALRDLKRSLPRGGYLAGLRELGIHRRRASRYVQLRNKYETEAAASAWGTLTEALQGEEALSAKREAQRERRERLAVTAELHAKVEAHLEDRAKLQRELDEARRGDPVDREELARLTAWNEELQRKLDQRPEPPAFRRRAEQLSLELGTVLQVVNDCRRCAPKMVRALDLLADTKGALARSGTDLREPATNGPRVSHLVDAGPPAADEVERAARMGSGGIASIRSRSMAAASASPTSSASVP